MRANDLSNAKPPVRREPFDKFHHIILHFCVKSISFEKKLNNSSFPLCDQMTSKGSKREHWMNESEQSRMHLSWGKWLKKFNAHEGERKKVCVCMCGSVFMTEREWRVKTWANPGLFLVYLTFSPFPPSTQHDRIERTRVRFPKSALKFCASTFFRNLFLPCSCHLDLVTCDSIFSITMRSKFDTVPLTAWVVHWGE